MDRDHRLDAPDNESLSTIEQLSDHSELSTIYPHAKNDWEGAELISKEDREKKRNEAQIKINLSIRSMFVPIGILAVLPFVLAAILVVIAGEFLNIKNLAFLLLPVCIAVFLWAFISYKSYKTLYEIFYSHSMRMVPFVFTLVVMVGLTMQGHYVIALPLYSNSLIANTAVSGLIVVAISVALSGVLLMLWTSQALSAHMKFACIGLIALGIVIATTIVNFL